jgi:FHA domain
VKTTVADVSYVPGPLTAVVGDQFWALFAASPDTPAVTRIWQQFAQGVAVDALLVGLLADGVGGAPGLALLAAGADGQHRLFCRGAVGATVVNTRASEGEAASEWVDGAGLLTWREHVVANVERIFLGEPPTDAALRLPATSGVLLAGCVIIDFTNFAARQTAQYQPEKPSERPKKTIVFYPDTVTVPPPDGDAGQVPDPGANDHAGGMGGPTAAVPGRRPNDGSGNTGEYDFLWGATQMLSVADAAIRGPGDGGLLPPGQFASGAPTVSGRWAGGLPSGPPPVMPADPPPPSRLWPGPDDSVQLGVMPPGVPPPNRSLPGPPGGLIDVPRWLAGPDESGSTVKRDELPEPLAGTRPPDRIGPVVPALICPNGHMNPPSDANCRRCGALLPHDPVSVPRPVLGVLRLSLGDVITLDRGVVMGRSPRTDFAGADGEERPHVVKLPSTDGDISRTHVRVTLDGWHVLVTDLNSTNGTLVTLPGRNAQQLRPSEPTPIQPGTIVTLAEGIDFRYEVID